MPNFRKKRVNPYLFLLLKRMLDYEVSGISSRPSKSQVKDFVYERRSVNKPTDKNKTWKDRDKIAEKIAESIRKDLLTPKDFEFSIEKLNLLAEEVTILDRLFSWDIFVEKYKSDTGAEIAERDFMYCSFSELTIDHQERIAGWVESKLIKLHLDYERDDKANNHVIIKSTENFVIRTASVHDLKDIVKSLVSTDVVELDKFARMKSILKKNRNVYYIYKDHYDLWGFVSLLPIKDNVFELLPEKQDKISADDIYNNNENEKVRYILLSLEWKHKVVYQMLLHYLEQMITSIAQLDNDLIFCVRKNVYDDEEYRNKYKWEKTPVDFLANKGYKIHYYYDKFDTVVIPLNQNRKQM